VRGLHDGVDGVGLVVALVEGALEALLELVGDGAGDEVAGGELQANKRE
jgi:hypothetical protein